MAEDRRQTTIDTVRLQRFRSYSDSAFEFEPGVNIIVGPNASGKTNLLEALLMACRGKSFRARDAEIFKFGSDWARIDVAGPACQRTVKLKQSDQHTQKEFVLNGQSCKRMSLPKTLPVVLFEPNHLQLLHGSPERRRDYLDDLLEQTVPGYGRTRREYRRILVQRNSLLKSVKGLTSHIGAGELFAWNVRLSETGAVLARERHRLTEKINSQIGDLYNKLSASDQYKITMKYANAHNIETYSSALLRSLEERQNTDILRGFTSAGPHREDFSISFDGRAAAEVASRGETRTVLLGLKIMELQLIEEARDPASDGTGHSQKPLLLLDDVFSELDGRRRKALTETLKTHQAFITTTDADIVLHHFTDDCRVIPLGGG